MNNIKGYINEDCTFVTSPVLSEHQAKFIEGYLGVKIERSYYLKIMEVVTIDRIDKALTAYDYEFGRKKE